MISKFEFYFEFKNVGDFIKTRKISVIDFVNKNFDESMSKLKVELERAMKTKNREDEVKSEFPREPDPAKWTETDVAMWAKSMRFHPGLRASLKSCDGKLLREVYDMRQEAPQFLFKLMEDSKNALSSESTATGATGATHSSFNLTHFNNFCRELNSLFCD